MFKKVSKRKIMGDEGALDCNGDPYDLKNSKNQVKQNQEYQNILNLKTDKNYKTGKTQIHDFLEKDQTFRKISNHVLGISKKLKKRE